LYHVVEQSVDFVIGDVGIHRHQPNRLLLTEISMTNHGEAIDVQFFANLGAGATRYSEAHGDEWRFFAQF